MASLKHQFLSSIDGSFQEGRDKHSDKQNGGQGDYKVYSYSSLHNLKDFATNLTGYLKEEYNIKNIKDIKDEMVQGFLNNKAATCTQHSLNIYKANICKLQEIVNHNFNSCNVDWKNSIVSPASLVGEKTKDRGVNSVMSIDDFKKIIQYAENSGSTSKAYYAVLIEGALGIRVEELAQMKVYNVGLDKNTITLDNTKGGKILERELSPRVKNIFEELIRGKSANDKVLDIKSGSINKWLNRVEDKLGLDRHSTHDIRRMVAQEKYDQFRREGCTPKEAVDKTSRWLNHNKDRGKLLKESYIKVW